MALPARYPYLPLSALRGMEVERVASEQKKKNTEILFFDVLDIFKKYNKKEK